MRLGPGHDARVLHPSVRLSAWKGWVVADPLAMLGGCVPALSVAARQVFGVVAFNSWDGAESARRDLQQQPAHQQALPPPRLPSSVHAKPIA